MFRVRHPHMHSVRVIDATAGSLLLCVCRLGLLGEPARMVCCAALETFRVLSAEQEVFQDAVFFVWPTWLLR